MSKAGPELERLLWVGGDERGVDIIAREDEDGI